MIIRITDILLEVLVILLIYTYIIPSLKKNLLLQDIEEIQVLLETSLQNFQIAFENSYKEKSFFLTNLLEDLERFSLVIQPLYLKWCNLEKKTVEIDSKELGVDLFEQKISEALQKHKGAFESLLIQTKNAETLIILLFNKLEYLVIRVVPNLLVLVGEGNEAKKKHCYNELLEIEQLLQLLKNSLNELPEHLVSFEYQTKALENFFSSYSDHLMSQSIQHAQDSVFSTVAQGTFSLLTGLVHPVAPLFSFPPLLYSFVQDREISIMYQNLSKRYRFIQSEIKRANSQLKSIISHQNNGENGKLDHFDYLFVELGSIRQQLHVTVDNLHSFMYCDDLSPFRSLITAVELVTDSVHKFSS